MIFPLLSCPEHSGKIRLHYTNKQGAACHGSFACALNITLENQQITSSQMDCAQFWKAFMLSSEENNILRKATTEALIKL